MGVNPIADLLWGVQRLGMDLKANVATWYFILFYCVAL